VLRVLGRDGKGRILILRHDDVDLDTGCDMIPLAA
jgi:hypothetical protein